jgi:hypothetical protein
MSRRWIARAALVAAMLLGFPASTLGAARASVPHPRLLFAPADVADLRTKVRDGGDDDEAWQSLQTSWLSYATTRPVYLVAPMSGAGIICELGLLAHLSADGRAAAAKTAEVALYVARQYEVDDDEFESALRLRTLAFGYDFAFHVLSDAERDELRAEMRSYLEYMPRSFNATRYLHNPYTSNKGPTVGGALGLAAIAMWDESSRPEREILETALGLGHRLVEKCFDDILASDGAYREGVLYGAWTMRMAIPYIEARRRFDGVDLGADPRIERMAEWLAYEVLPEGGGRTNNVNDSPWFMRPLAVHSTYLDWAQTRFGSAVAGWVYDHTAGNLGFRFPLGGDRVATVLWNQPSRRADPATRLPRARLFRDRGLYAYRSAWKQTPKGTEILFSLHAGRFFGGHAQEDQGQFTLYAHGDRYVVDNGAAHPTGGPKESAAHNLVLVDGLGQHNAGSSIGTDAHIESALLAPYCDWVRADLDPAYATYSPFNAPDVPFPGTRWDWGYVGANPMQRADRTAVVVKSSDAPTWFLIADDIQKDAALHRYEWLLHTDAANTVDVSGDPVVIAATGGRLLVWFARPRPPALDVSAAPFENGGEDSSTVRLVGGIATDDPGFVVAMAPLAWATPAPVVHRSELGGRATRLRLSWDRAEDDVVVNPAGALVESDVRTDGRLALVHTSRHRVTSWALSEGTQLDRGGMALARLDARASATMSQRTLHLDRADVGFAAWGPDVTRVMGPDGDVPFVRDGDWVRTQRPGVPPPDPAGDLGFAIAVDCDAARDAPIVVRVHDVRGRLVRRLDSSARTGRKLVWDGLDARGTRVAAGVYFARVQVCDNETTRRILVVR